MPSLPSSLRQSVMAGALRLVTEQLLPRIDQAAEESARPFRQAAIMRPEAGSLRWGWTHYGIFLPQLPEPFRYCNLMTMIGASGTTMFDNDHLVRTTPRDTAFLLSSTAAGAGHLLRFYSVRDECDLAADGSRLRFGNELEIRGRWPRFQATADWDDFRLELDIECTDTVSWFVRNPAYDHLSLLSTCSGTLVRGGQSLTLERTLCTFEYARCVSPQVLARRPLPDALKVPADFFVYNVINIDATTQLLLTHVRALGNSAVRSMHERSIDGRSAMHVDDVAFTVLEYDPEPAIDPVGRRMRLPRVFAWTVREHGEELLAIRCVADAPWRWGHGRGYAGAFHYEGRYRGRAVAGSAYIEYIDSEEQGDTP